jgi:hypothetical protein
MCKPILVHVPQINQSALVLHTSTSCLQASTATNLLLLLVVVVVVLLLLSRPDQLRSLRQQRVQGSL